MSFLADKSLLLTGGTGSFGQKFVEYLLKNHPRIKRLIIFSRDELKQFEMSQKFPSTTYPQLRYVLGDIRDKERLRQVSQGVDIIIHAAALKQVDTAEQNPFEFIQTNIIGSYNLIESALYNRVKRVVALSTDKAVAPVSLYGATKLCADKLFINANWENSAQTVFSVVRYGNVLGSRGSVVPFFLQARQSGILPITHPYMTRFNISLQEVVDVVLFALENALGGEIFVPKSPSYRLIDLAEAICPTCQKKLVGLRAGEKIHEELLTIHESHSTIETSAYYIIVPRVPTEPFQHTLSRYITHHQAQAVTESFAYSSDRNSHWLSIEELRRQIKLYVDKNFTWEASTLTE